MKNLLFLLLIFPTVIFSQNLILLAENNNLPEIMRAVQRGVDVNMVDPSGFTALHVAAWNGYSEIARFLLQNGANPNIVSKSGSTPLRFANPQIKSLLISYGAYEPKEEITIPRLLYSPNIYVQKPTPTPQPIIVQAPPSVGSSQSRQKPVVRNFITNVTNTIYVSNFISNTFMEYDYPRKSYDLLVQLSPEESTKLQNWDTNGNNSVLQAAAKGDLEKVQQLVAFGINPKSRNSQGDTALRFAVESENMDLIKYFVEEVGIDVNAANNNGTSPLLIATYLDQVDTIQYLGQMGANPNQTAEASVTRIVDGAEQVNIVSNWTAIMTASQQGFTNSIKALLDIGANINAQDSAGWNSLFFASQNNYLDAAKCLVANKINTQVQSYDNITALSLAIDNGNEDMTVYLEDIGAMRSSTPREVINESTYEEQSTEDVVNYDYGDGQGYYNDFITQEEQ